MPGLRLGYYYHIPVKDVSARKISSLGVQGRFVDSLAAECGELVCFFHGPGSRDLYHYDYQIKRNNVRLVPLGPKGSAPSRTFFPGNLQRAFTEGFKDLDALLIRGPSPLLPPLCRWARKVGVPTALLIVGNYVDGIADLRQPAWRRLLIGWYLRLYNVLQKGEVQKCLTFVNSHKLFVEFADFSSALVETRTTTLDESDFFEHFDTCTGDIVRILYVGRYDIAKGLKLIVEAVAGLAGKGLKCELHLAGWETSPRGGVMEELKSLAASLGAGDVIRDHGFVPVGEELWKIYRNSDIFVNASQASEGFPRTIWEAMANSVPVVATDVGSIRAFAGQAVELVEPRSVRSLQDGIARVISDGAKRRAMISEGFKMAKSNTLSARAREIVSGIEELAKNYEGRKNGKADRL